MQSDRVIGFDLARSYAIWGMYMVNFTFCFGTFADQSILGRFLPLFVGNSTSIFIILAGMGLSMMSSRGGENEIEKTRTKNIVLKRSWYLFALGLLLYNWWPGDILHFYGGYMHIAAFLLFFPKKYYLWAAVLAVTIFHILLFIIPIDTGVNLGTFEYADFWTPAGFVRNTLYNGWNSIFPWLAFFMVGMWMGKLNWQDKQLRIRIFLTGLILLSMFKGLRMYVRHDFHNEKMHTFYSKYWDYIMSEYFPPFLPFMAITTGFALMVIPVCMLIGERLPQNRLIRYLTQTGRMTLTHYILHITLGMVIFSNLTGMNYTGLPTAETPATPLYVFTFANLFFLFSVLFTVLWNKRFKHGPFEMLMRKISNSI